MRGYKFNSEVKVIKKSERQVPVQNVKVDKVGVLQTCQNWLVEMVEAKIEARERDLQVFYGNLQRI